jgi:hypothetical protein
MNKRMLESVTDIQKEFVYNELAIGNYTIYYCHKPDTSTYSFEIVLGRMGIYVGGDIDSLTFKVARGLEFLAGNDVDYYIHSKLEHIYYEKREFCKEYLDDFLAEYLWEATDRLEIEELEEGMERPGTLKEIVEFYKKHALDKDVWESRPDTKPHNKAWSLYADLQGVEDLPEIYHKIHDSEYYRQTGEMPPLTRPDHGVMFCLYMVHHAAKKILQNKKVTPV